MVYIHNGYCSTFRKNIALPIMARGKNLEKITLSEISQAQKDKYHMFSFTYEAKKFYFTELESRIMVISG